MKHLRHLLALALAAALTLMLLLPTYAAVIDGVYTDYMTA
ncbi:unknown [Firmicutes bacterium CAG:83]|nr:unknown [Firmicutes bacterium CAG:83]